MADRGIEAPLARPRAGRTRSVVWVLVAILAGAAFLYWLTHRAPTGTAAVGAAGGRRPPTTVGIAKVTLADVPLTLDALGTVTPPVTATVRARIAGTLDQVNFSEGQEVDAGQLLAEVDPRPYKLALAQAQGQLQRDVAQQQLAAADLQRYQTLLQQDSIARQQVDTQRALVGQLGGTLATDRAAVGVAQLNLKYTRVVAPVAGRVGLRQVDVGNYVTPADTGGIVVLTQVHPIDVVFTLPEAQTRQVLDAARRGQGLPVTALGRNGNTVLAHGRFATFDNRVDTSTGTLRAKARFANDNNALFPNQFVNIRLTYGVLAQAKIVSVTAVRNGPKGSFVYVVHPDRTAEQRPVTTGASYGDKVALRTGVEAGETVVTEGADKLNDGDKVMLPGDRRGGASGAGGYGGGAGHGGSGSHRHRQDAAAP